MAGAGATLREFAGSLAALPPVPTVVIEAINFHQNGFMSMSPWCSW